MSSRRTACRSECVERRWSEWNPCIAENPAAVSAIVAPRFVTVRRIPGRVGVPSGCRAPTSAALLLYFGGGLSIDEAVRQRIEPFLGGWAETERRLTTPKDVERMGDVGYYRSEEVRG